MADRARVAAPGNRSAAAVTPEDWERAKGILDAALELPAADRPAYVAAAAGGDAALAREVESLLAANEGD